MKKTLLIFSILFFRIIPSSIFAQDVILKNDGEEIASKITEITLDEVKYRKFSNPSGPVYTAPQSEIFMIKYENGDRDVFEKDAETGKISLRHTANPNPVQVAAPPVAATKTKSSTSSKTSASGGAKSETVKPEKTEAPTQVSPPPSPPPPVAAKGAVASFKFRNYTIPIQIGEISKGEDGKTLVEVLGAFDIKTETAYTGLAAVFGAVMKMKITVGEKKIEVVNIIAGEGGIQSTFSAGGLTGLKFKDIKFGFDTSELPDSITVYNDECTITFDGKTKAVIKK